MPITQPPPTYAVTVRYPDGTADEWTWTQKTTIQQIARSTYDDLEAQGVDGAEIRIRQQIAPEKS
jgi:hypothetical protein